MIYCISTAIIIEKKNRRLDKMIELQQSIRPTWVVLYAVLFVTLLSYSVTGQQFVDPADYDYSDFSNFRAVASPAALPPRDVQRQARQRAPAQQQFQASTRGELPRRDDSRRGGNPGRGEAVPQDVQQRVAPKTVAILKQINENNEDGSYTYGYEADDGSFKLETRHVDGRVEGKYGYIDIDTGEVKVIQYGADNMGFAPSGDLPEGIVVPVVPGGNATFDYDYDTGDYDNGDYVEQQDVSPNPQLNTNGNEFRVQNRARGNVGAPIPGAPTQNRGQNVRAPPVPRKQEEPRNSFLPTPAPASRTRFQARPVVEQQPTRQSQPQRARPQAVFQPAAPVRQEAAPVDQFTAFQTNFDGSRSLIQQGLKPFVPRQLQPTQRPPPRPTPTQRRPASQPARRPQENVRSLSLAPSRQQQFTREEVQELDKINEIRSNIPPSGAVRSQIPPQPQRTLQRGGGRRVVAKRPLNAVPTSSSSGQTSTRSRGRGRGSSRTRTSAALNQAANQASPPVSRLSPQRQQSVNRPSPQVGSVTEDPLAVLRGLQATAGRSSGSNVPEASAPRARPSGQSELRSKGIPSSSDQKFTSFPARDSPAGSTSSLPSRRPQPVPQSQPRQPPRAQPIRTLPTITSQTLQREQPRTFQRQPIRIKARPSLQKPVDTAQQIIPQRPPQPVIPPQQQVRRPVQQQPAQGAIRSLPQQNQNRFLPTPIQPISPTAAVPNTIGFQNPVDFDALISEFTGRQTPRPQAPSRQFSPFRPTPATNRAGGRPLSGAVPQFVPRPAAAVPLGFQTPTSPSFDVNGSSFQLNQVFN